VALTAYSNSDKKMKQQCYQNGMNQILSKPINFEIIKELFIRVNVSFKLGVKEKKE
jgi:CheY-like chemotaxis protein